MRRMQFAVVGALLLISVVVGQSLQPTFQSDLMVAANPESSDVVESEVSDLESSPAKNTALSQTNLPFDIRWLMIVPAFVLGMLTHAMIWGSRSSQRDDAPAKPMKKVASERQNDEQPAPDSKPKGTLALVARERKKSQQLTEELAELQRELRLAKSNVRDLEKQLSAPTPSAPVDQMNEVGFHPVDNPK